MGHPTKVSPTYPVWGACAPAHPERRAAPEARGHRVRALVLGPGIGKRPENSENRSLTGRVCGLRDWHGSCTKQQGKGELVMWGPGWGPMWGFGWIFPLIGVSMALVCLIAMLRWTIRGGGPMCMGRHQGRGPNEDGGTAPPGPRASRRRGQAEGGPLKTAKTGPSSCPLKQLSAETVALILGVTALSGTGRATGCPTPVSN